MNHPGSFPLPFKLNQWLVQPALNRISGAGGENQIEPRVMRVLLVLADKPWEVVSREELLDQVWGDAVVGEEILTRAISELRRVFGDSARDPQYIETIRHHGYRLIADVEPATAPAPEPESTVAPPAPAAEPVSEEKAPPGSGPGSWLRLAVIGAVLVILAIFGPRLLKNGSSEKEVNGFAGPPAASPITSFPGREQFPALSADGTRVAFAMAGPDGDGIGIHIKQRNSESTLRLTDEPGWAAWPVWSPDGQTVAYVQGGDSLNVISLVPSLGGASRPLYEVAGWVEGLDWSPDRKTLVFSARDPATLTHRLFLLSLDDLEVTPLPTERPDGAGDFLPRFSPDGSTLAWIGLDQTGRTGLFTVPSAGGTVRTVHMGMAALQGLAWTSNGGSLVYAAAPAGRFDLWRIDVAGGSPVWIPTPGDFAWNPTIARQTGELVYEEVRANQDLWRIRILGRDPWQLETGPFIRSTRWEYEADYHPDGGKLVFVSARSGRPELWLGDRGGENLRRLTSLGAEAVSTPRWSPDGNSIAFNVMMGGRSDIRIIQERGGEPVSLPGPEGPRVFSGWCADGLHLLVGADRGQGWQIYRESVAGGESTRLTSAGGLTAQESPTGKELFFTNPGRPGLWRLSLGGNNQALEPDLVIPDLLHQDRRNWRLVADGDRVDRIAWVMRVGNNAFLMFFDLAAGNSSFLTELPGLAGPGLALAPDGSEIVYARTENMAGDLMLLEGILP
jgi:Tol biopolymer transport system component/DNA-binding winged helix-turn-helix (wHTH) protein